MTWLDVLCARGEEGGFAYEDDDPNGCHTLYLLPGMQTQECNNEGGDRDRE